MRRLCLEAPMPFDEAAAWATDAELTAARSFAPARAQEFLAWRAIVRRETGRDTAIAYNAAGAPILPHLPLHIAVSHCPGRVAVAISDRPCALDIERVDRNFRRILPRYLSPTEQAISDDPHFPAIAWCAKETLYKYAGVPGCDLLHDLRIDGLRGRQLPPCDRPEGLPAGIASGTLSAHLAGKAARNATETHLTLHFCRDDAFVTVFLFE